MFVASFTQIKRCMNQLLIRDNDSVGNECSDIEAELIRRGERLPEPSLGVLLVMKTLKDERYVAIMAYKYSILHDFTVSMTVHTFVTINKRIKV